MRRWIGLALVPPLALLLASIGPPAAAPAAVSRSAERVASVEGITEYRLANGLRVLLFPDATKKTVTVNITYLVGSRHEGSGERGMAHLLEHLLFKGSPRHPDIPKELTLHGSNSNGSTWFDGTNYFETVSASDENLAWAIDLEADRMVNSFVSKKDLDSEMTVVRNEFEIGENYPQGVLTERLYSTAYLWHNYGHATIGSRSDIERVPIERLQAFYRTWYQPDNAVLVVGGRFDESRALALIHDKFGRIPRPKRSLPATWTVEPPQDGERMVTLRRVGDSRMAAVAYHVPAGPHPDTAALDLLTFLLADNPSGRLYKDLVEAGKASYVYAQAEPLHDPGLLLVSAYLRTGSSAEEARDIAIQVTEGLAASPPAAGELERARRSRLKEWDEVMKDSEWTTIWLSEWAALGDWRLMFVHRDRIRRVTPEDIQRVGAAYLKPSNRTVGLYVPTPEPDRTLVPGAPDVAGLVKDYQGEEAMAQGEALDPSPEAIEKRVVRRTLPSGLKLAIVDKKTRAHTVYLALSLHFGDAASLRGRRGAARLAGAMLMRGTRTRSKEEIQDAIDSLDGSLWVSGGTSGAEATFEVPRKNLEAALRLSAEILREPAFPGSELKLLKQAWLLGYEDSRSDPGTKASTAWEKHMNRWPVDDPRYVPDPDEAIEETQTTTLKEIKAFHADFYGASHGELGVVGEVDADEIATLVTELFGDWRSPRPYARLDDPYRERPALERMIEAPDKESAVFLAGMPLRLQETDLDYPAMVLGDFMTGGGFLSSRLASRIRQKDGISYGIGSSLSTSPWEPSGWFMANAIYAPQNAGRLVAAFREEMTKILEKGFGEDEIRDARRGWLEERLVWRSQDWSLASRLVGNEHLGRTFAWDAALERNVAALTNREILAAMRKHLDLAKMTLIQAGDFASAAKVRLEPAAAVN
jgi:zinc protease